MNCIQKLKLYVGAPPCVSLSCLFFRNCLNLTVTSTSDVARTTTTSSKIPMTKTMNTFAGSEPQLEHRSTVTGAGREQSTGG